LAALPETLGLREVRYGVGALRFRTRQSTLVTTRLAAERYRVADLAELYRQRWQGETALAQLKTTMPMDVLHGTTVPGMLKELTVCAIVYNLVSLVLCQSAPLQHIGVEWISFVDALRWLGAPNTGMPLGALIVNPARPHRVEPRVKKPRPKPLPLMITPPASTPSAADPASVQELTSCHSAKSFKSFRSVETIPVHSSVVRCAWVRMRGVDAFGLLSIRRIYEAVLGCATISYMRRDSETGRANPQPRARIGVAGLLGFSFRPIQEARFCG
jgi:hypothetical protein